LAAKFKVSQQLRFVYRTYLRHRFQFDDYQFFNENINTISGIDSDAVIDNG